MTLRSALASLRLKIHKWRLRMSTIDPSISNPARAAALDGDLIVRSILFLAAFLLIWLTASPFPDLGDPKLLEPVGDGNPVSQALAILLTLALVLFVLVKHPRMIRIAASPMLMLTLAWFALSAVASPYPALAGRRLVLAVFTILQAAAFLLLPRDRDHFSRLLAVAALFILLVCYAGVLFAPELSIHQMSDVAEPELAGNWRGAFTHKNGAGAAMVVLIFIGIFVVRSFNPVIGAAIIALAGTFLLFTESKSSLRLLPLVLAVSFLIFQINRPPAAKLALALSMPVIVGGLTIGSVSSETIEGLVGAFLSDPTFTGREDIWRFTLDHIAQRPLLGYGFQAFWGTPDLVASWSYLGSWGYRASDAHNGYLNIAVMTGLVGLVLCLLWILVQPLEDHIRTGLGRSDPALTALFLQMWLFGLCLSGFESVLFSNGDCIWFMMLVAIIGLRFQASAVLAR
jgi:O-antigen ligase